MSPGCNTRTGGVLEATILPALKQRQYKWTAQVHIGQRLGQGRHYVDAVAEKNGRKHLISVKWQQVSGTAEQKVPFEVICLVEAMQAQPRIYHKAYVILGGEGWKLRSFYTSSRLAAIFENPGERRSSNPRVVHRKEQIRGRSDGR